MQILRHQDYIRMPWKNGLGITEEVIAFPSGSGLADFGWRLSIAHVGADGPFSLFAGIDRTIALLDGEGLLLDLPGQTVELAPGGEPLPFSGDLEISSRNTAGPTIDLNVMTRRGQFEHRMSRIQGAASIEIANPLTILIFNAPASVSCRESTSRMGRFDALLATPEDGPLHIDTTGDAVIFRIEITAT